jgi:hypothetical protein
VQSTVSDQTVLIAAIVSSVAVFASYGGGRYEQHLRY